MKRVAGLVCYQWDRIVVRWRDPKTGEAYSQAKRVSGKCPLTPDERRLYVHCGSARAIRAIMERRGFGFKEAKALLIDATRGRW